MYTPINANVYLEAYAGCLAGLGAAGKYLSDPIGSSYSGETLMAAAYAQQFDTTWGATTPTGLELATICETSEAVWEQRSPLEISFRFLPQAYASLVNGVIALCRQGNAQVMSDGIDPNAIGGGGGASLVANTRYVAATGSDATGTGGLFSPFLTIQKALDTILTASSAQPWVVRVGPGAYPDAFNLKPWIAIVGTEQVGPGAGGVGGRMATEISAGTDTIGLDASFANSTVTASWCAFLGFQNHQTASGGTATIIPQLMFSQCALPGGWSFVNGDNTQAQAIAVFDDCSMPTPNGLVDADGWGSLVLRQSSAFAADAIAQANGTQATQLLLINSWVQAVLIESGSLTPGASLLSLNSVVDDLTAIGSTTLLQFDGVGAPSGTHLIGAPPPQWLSYSAVSADWSNVAPTSLANALDRIAAKVGPIP
jgi:hypothetical protein